MEDDSVLEEVSRTSGSPTSSSPSSVQSPVVNSPSSIDSPSSDSNSRWSIDSPSSDSNSRWSSSQSSAASSRVQQRRSSRQRRPPWLSSGDFVFTQPVTSMFEVLIFCKYKVPFVVSCEAVCTAFTNVLSKY